MELPIITERGGDGEGDGAPSPGPPGGASALDRRRLAINEYAPPQRLIEWALARFESWKIVVTTGFGMEGCALVDMIARTGAGLTITYLDTHFFFPETRALRDELASRYPHLRFENAGTALTPEEQERQYGPELWRTDPDRCCMLRKVAPMWALMESADVWLTGIRRDQSPARANTQVVEWDWRFDALKVNPLAYWTRKHVWEYIREHGVPYNPLHERGYPSIGCTHCTRAVPGSEIGEYSRDGRWADMDKTECGLHLGENI